jgi:hypothetical protein
VALVVQGAVVALGAALCLASAVQDTAAAAVGRGPVLPVCGVLFLLAAIGPFQQARFDRNELEVFDTIPGKIGEDIVTATRRSERISLTFCALYLVLGGALLASPLFLKREVWQLARLLNQVGCWMAVGGLVLSGLGFFVVVANGLAMEGASRDLALVGDRGILGGAILTALGGGLAVAGKSGHPGPAEGKGDRV